MAAEEEQLIPTLPVDHRSFTGAQGLCTYSFSGTSKILGQVWKCNTCRKVKGATMCEACAKTCHAKCWTENVSHGWSERYFCDCGAQNGTYDVRCQCLAKSDDFVTLKRWPLRDLVQEGDRVLIEGMLKDGRRPLVFSPDGLRMACLAGGKAFANHDEAIPYVYAPSKDVVRAVGVFGDAPYQVTGFQFPCTNEGALSAQAVNSFVSKNTKGLIPSIVTQEALRLTTASVVSVTYFKGEWESPFYPAIEGMFHGLNGIAFVPLMSKFLEGAHFSDSENFQSLVLNYRNSKVRAVFTRLISDDKAPKLEEAMQNECIQREYLHHHATGKNARKFSGEADIIIPKFRIESSFGNVVELMKKSGLKKEACPSFPRIIHKAVIEVDEKGTVASQASCFEKDAFGCAQNEPRKWHGNVPFLFALVDGANGSPFFCGLVDFTTKTK